MTLNSSVLKVKPETCSVLSTMGDSLRIHYTVRQKWTSVRIVFYFLRRQAAKSWNAVRHVCLFCQAVQLRVVYVAPSDPCVRGTTQLDSSAAGVGQCACGVRLGGVRLIAVVSHFYLPCEKIASVSCGEHGAVQHVSSHSFHRRGSTPVQPVKPSQLDYDTSPPNWTMTHAHTLGGWKYPNMKMKLSICNQFFF